MSEWEQLSRTLTIAWVAQALLMTWNENTQELTLEFQIHGAARPIQASIKFSNLDVGGFRDLQSYSELYDE